MKKKNKTIDPFSVRLVIDTPEAAENLLRAIEDREKNGPAEIGPTLGVCTDPEVYKKLKEAWIGKN